MAGDNIESAAPAWGAAGELSQPANLLQVLRETQQQQMQQQQQQQQQQLMQQQQLQQQQMLAALMQQLIAPGVSPRLEPGHQLVAPPPLPSPNQGRPSLQAGDPQQAAPRPPRAPDICSQCEYQEADICLHSYAPSDLSGGSVGSQRHHSEGPSTTGAAPRLPPPWHSRRVMWAARFRPVTPARRSPPPLQMQRRSSHTTPAA